MEELLRGAVDHLDNYACCVIFLVAIVLHYLRRN